MRQNQVVAEQVGHVALRCPDVGVASGGQLRVGLVHLHRQRKVFSNRQTHGPLGTTGMS